MNKKLFTLAAGLLLGSAFVVNAQTPGEAALTAGTEIDGETYYFLGSGGKYLKGENVKVTATGNEFTRIVSEAVTSNYDIYALWKVIPSVDNGVSYVTLVNKGTEKTLAFKANGSAVAAGDDADPVVTKLAVGADWKDEDGNGVYELDGTSLTIRVSGLTAESEKWLKLTETTWSLDGGNVGAAAKVSVVPVAETDVTSDQLNRLLGDGFTFNFPNADPAPAENVFSSKLQAVEVPSSQVGKTTLYYSSVMTGTYFVADAEEGAIVENGGKLYFKDEANFKASKVVALDPIANYGINGLTNGGHKFTTVLAGDLVAVDAKEKTNKANATFTVIERDKVNAEGAYIIKLTPHVAASKDEVPGVIDGTNVQKVMAITSSGTTYVTITAENDRGASNKVFDAKVSGSNVLAAADLLKTDGAAVFNIQFTSGKDKLENGSEYGKYLRVTPNSEYNGWELLAQGSTYVNLNAPESQWIITDYANGIFTFTNREVNGQTLAVELRKTDTKDVYDAYIAGDGKSFKYAYVNDNGQYTVGETAANFNSGKIQVKLVPATMTLNGGFADFTEEELANPVQVKFTMNTALFSKEMYLTTKDKQVALTAEEDEAALWDIVKFAAKADSISSKIKYAYLKDKKVTKSDAVDNIGITTYALKLNGEDKYLDGVKTLTATKKLSEATRQIIKVLNDGSLYIFNASTATDNTFAGNVGKNSKAISVTNTAELTKDAVSIYDNHQTASVMEFVPVEVLSESLEAEPRHASFKSVNGGFLGMNENNDAIVAATQEEAKTLTFWLDTTDVKELSTSFYISQAMPEGLKAAEPRMFLFNANDSTQYYDEGTASVTTDLNYLLSDKLTPKAIFKAATLINKDSINTIIKGEEVGLNKDNGLDMFKFQIKAVDDEEYVIANGKLYLSSINGKVGLTENLKNALVVTLGEGDATANEAIAAEGVQVIGGKGAVTVQGAAGKVITVANILGQTIANQVAASDNVTIAVPAGIVVVAVEGEATKVVVK